MAREKRDYRANLESIRERFDTSGMLTVGQVASWLKVDRHKVAALIESGRLVGTNVGLGRKNAVWRVSVEALARFSS